MVEFVKQAFGATERMRMPAGGGVHVELLIGDSLLMMGGGEALHGDPVHAALHLYVPDADAVYRQALAAGATSLREPTDQPYGDHEASVRDASGNHWYIATPLKGSVPPSGMRTVTPYLHPRGAAELIDFLKQVFDAREVERHLAPDGTIAHAKVQLGDSILEMCEAHGDAKIPMMFYVYVGNCDVPYQRAIEAGAHSLEAPADQSYGDRRAAFKDAWDNLWYTATPSKDAPRPS
jgi:uncharacterized glyoxalase superfamily protein PhnB